MKRRRKLSPEQFGDRPGAPRPRTPPPLQPDGNPPSLTTVTLWFLPRLYLAGPQYLDPALVTQVVLSADRNLTPALKEALAAFVGAEQARNEHAIRETYTDRDEAFEAFLLEVLGDFQITIPEMGTVKAEHPPIVVITSNRTREVHDALKRRCLYHWVGYPSAERELAIVRTKVPGVSKKLSEQVVAFVQGLRKQDLFKSPGVAETLDWAAALSELDVVALDPATVSDTLGVLLKYQDDIAKLEGSKVKEMLDEVKSDLRAAE